jgi:hypothetical protein
MEIKVSFQKRDFIGVNATQRLLDVLDSHIEVMQYFVGASR